MGWYQTAGFRAARARCGTHRSCQTPSAPANYGSRDEGLPGLTVQTTHFKLRSDPSSDGMAPDSWFPCSQSSLRHAPFVPDAAVSICRENCGSRDEGLPGLTVQATHRKFRSDPSSDGMAPDSWLSFNRRELHASCAPDAVTTSQAPTVGRTDSERRRDVQVAPSRVKPTTNVTGTTHVKAVNDPSDEVMLPYSWFMRSDTTLQAACTPDAVITSQTASAGPPCH
jgi:hypothetical protein